MVEDKKEETTKMEDPNYCKPKAAAPASLDAFNRCFQGTASSIFEMKCCGKRIVNKEGFMILSIPIKPAEYPRHVEGSKISVRIFVQLKNWINLFNDYTVQLTADEHMTAHDLKLYVCKKLGFDSLRFRLFTFDGKGPVSMLKEKEHPVRSFDRKELVLVEDFLLSGLEIPLSSEQHNEKILDGTFTLAYIRFKDSSKLASFRPIFVDSSELLAANLWTASYQLFEESGNASSRYFNFHEYVESPEYDFSIKIVAKSNEKKLDYFSNDQVIIAESSEIQIDIRNSSMRVLKFVREVSFLDSSKLQLDEVINPCSLQQIMTELYSPEYIEDYNCEACKKKTVCIKQEKLKYLPTYLAIHLNTLQMDMEYGEMLKTNRYIDIPLDNLDLTSVADLEEGETLAPFELVGVIHHVGDHQGGHYTASCRSNSKELWHYFDDEKTAEKSASGLALTSAVMVIYKKTTNPPTPEE